jgi:putative ABC transport system permease protein
MNADIDSLPGVKGVGEVRTPPLTGNGGSIRFAIEGRPKELGNEDEANIRDVSASYLRVMQIPPLKGRLYGVDDTMTSPPRALVNQAFADRYFPNEDAVGKRIRFTYSAKEPFREIIGVTSNENTEGLDTPLQPIIYASLEQSPSNGFYVVVRTSGDPKNMISAVRSTLQQLDPELPMNEPRSMDEIISSSYAVFLRRYPSYLIGSFAVLALVLAMVGLFGQISYNVAQRTREIGIRMALGAAPRDVLRMVLRQGFLLTISGLFVGLLATIGVTRLIGSLLFGVTPTDPLTFAGVALLLVAVAILATLLPAQRATRVDPLVALRYE